MEEELWLSSDDTQMDATDEYSDESFEQHSDSMEEELATFVNHETRSSVAVGNGSNQADKDQDQQDEYSQDSFEQEEKQAEQDDEETSHAMSPAVAAAEEDTLAPDSAVSQTSSNEWIFNKILHLKLMNPTRRQQLLTQSPARCRRGHAWNNLTGCQVDTLVDRLQRLKNSPSSQRPLPQQDQPANASDVLRAPMDQQQRIPSSLKNKALVHRFMSGLEQQQRAFEQSRATQSCSWSNNHSSRMEVDSESNGSPLACNQHDRSSGIRRRGDDGSLSTFCSVKKQKLLQEQLCTSSALETQQLRSKMRHEEFLSQIVQDQRAFLREFTSAGGMASLLSCHEQPINTNMDVAMAASYQCLESSALREQAQRLLSTTVRHCDRHCANTLNYNSCIG